MSDLLADIYSTVIPSAPYIIAAYALVWVALCVYMFIVHRRISHAEKEISVLEEALADQKGEATED